MAVIRTHTPTVLPSTTATSGVQGSRAREISGSAESSTGGRNHAVGVRCMGLAGGSCTTVLPLAEAVYQPRSFFSAFSVLWALPKSR